MEMDLNMKKLGQFIQVLMLSQQKILKTLVALFKNISLDVYLTVYQEHFVHKLTTK